MGLLGAIVEHPEDLYALVKLKMAADRIKKQIPAEPHWVFSYTMLQKVSRSFALVIQQLGPELRNAVTSSPHLPFPRYFLGFLVGFRVYVSYNVGLPFKRFDFLYFGDLFFLLGVNLVFGNDLRGRKDCKVLMDKFHSVSTAFSELGASYQEAIEDITKRMGAGMAKFICKEVETINDYDEYCHYVAGLIGLGLSKLFHVSGLEELAPDSLSNSMGLFLQKTNIIRDYLEDINEIPKSRMFWPQEIWSKYASKLEDLKYEENSTKAVQCLNEMVTNALMHAEDCLQYMSALKDLAIFRFCAIPQAWNSEITVIHISNPNFAVVIIANEIMAIGTLALCYNNVEVFRGVVKMRRGCSNRRYEIMDHINCRDDFLPPFPHDSFKWDLPSHFTMYSHQGLTARVIEQTRSMSDVYGAFFEFSSLLKSKIDDNDPNASLAHHHVEAIQKACISSGLLDKRGCHMYESRLLYNSALVNSCARYWSDVPYRCCF
ncbi:Squalene synthase [Cocos nucifera]|uniref:Squalene synthase n=1 Tax=Cocos nucifera TaxID=13894 RepID=A0A8K0IWJ8_COCNU|nr:Squalene synthase [Cocos nucifera]